VRWQQYGCLPAVLALHSQALLAGGVVPSACRRPALLVSILSLSLAPLPRL